MLLYKFDLVRSVSTKLHNWVNNEMSVVCITVAVLVENIIAPEI